MRMRPYLGTTDHHPVPSIVLVLHLQVAWAQEGPLQQGELGPTGYLIGPGKCCCRETGPGEEPNFELGRDMEVVPNTERGPNKGVVRKVQHGPGNTGNLETRCCVSETMKMEPD